VRAEGIGVPTVQRPMPWARAVAASRAPPTSSAAEKVLNLRISLISGGLNEKEFEREFRALFNWARTERASKRGLGLRIAIRSAVPEGPIVAVRWAESFDLDRPLLSWSRPSPRR
jgi:hypothetical protein